MVLRHIFDLASKSSRRMLTQKDPKVPCSSLRNCRIPSAVCRSTFIWRPLRPPTVSMVEEHVDFPYAGVGPDCSCYYGNGLYEDSEIDVGFGYNVVEVNRILAPVTLETISGWLGKDISIHIDLLWGGGCCAYTGGPYWTELAYI